MKKKLNDILCRITTIILVVICSANLFAQTNKKLPHTYPDSISPVGIVKGLNDEQLLEVIQKQTFRFFWDGAHPVSGLALERSNTVLAEHYCVENPKKFKGYGDCAWGLTASDGPFHYSADEPVLWQDHGKITPTGAISSFPYLPEQSMKALKNYYFKFGKFL